MQGRRDRRLGGKRDREERAGSKRTPLLDKRRHQVDVERLTRATLDADEIVEDGSAGHGRRGGLVSEIDHDGSFKEKRYGLVPKVERRGIAGDFELGLLVEVEDSRREVADGQVGRKRGDLGVAVDGADEM
jgi:hypothetical protein